MMRWVSVRRALVVLVSTAAVMLASPAAEAKCVRAKVAVHRYGQTDWVLLSDSTCLVPTPFPEDVIIQKTDTGHVPDAPIPAGTPTGVRTEVYVPL